MTDLTDVIRRSRTGWGSQQGSEARSGRGQAIAAALAAMRAAGIGLGVCMAAALAGWFLAQGGGHGQATDALRIGADGWLSGHGATIDASAGPLGITPLGLTLLFLVVGHRSGRRAALETAETRTLAGGAPLLAVGCATYVVISLVVAVLCTRTGAEPRLLPALAGALVVSALGLGTGLARGAGLLGAIGERIPQRVHEGVEVALTGAGLLLAAGAVVALVGLATSFTQAANVFTALDLTPGNAIVLLVVSALVVPNAALLGVAYLAGPGFAVGTGTSVTATSVTLGPLPAFPLLAGLPASGTNSDWAALVFAVPGLCAAFAAALAQSRSGDLAWDAVALRGFLGGLAGAVLMWLAVCMAGGPMGTGRMADIGASAGPVLVSLAGAMALGGLLGSLIVALWQRRRSAREDR